MADDTKQTPIASTVTWSSRVAVLLLTAVAALQQGGVLTSATANNTTTIINQLKPLVEQIEVAIAANKPPAPPVVVPVDPAILALQEQIRLQNEAIQKLLNPPVPVVVTPVVLPSAIKATDSQGKPITGDVPEGRQFRITGDVGTWTILPATSPDIDVDQYPDHLTCVLRNSAVLTVVHSSGSPITTSSLIVKCLKAANPPPVVVNPQPVDPVVDTRPVAGQKFTVAVVEDPAAIRTVTTASILNNLPLRDGLKTKGHTFEAHILNDGSPVAAYVKQMAVPTPALVILDASGHVVKSVHLPIDLGMSLLAGLGG